MAKLDLTTPVRPLLRPGRAGPSRPRPLARRLVRGLWSFKTLCLLPAVAYVILLFGYPAVFSIQLGFYSDNAAQFITHTGVFVGFANYTQLFSDATFISALLHTLIFAVVTVVAQFLFGLLIASLLNKQGIVYAGIRTLLLVPWLLPLIVSGNIWIWMLDNFYGVINYFLVTLHLTSHYVAWLSSPNLSLWAVIGANTWLGIPFNVMIIYAGLRAIPTDLYEAARVDGAGPLTRLTRITLPQLRDVTGVLILLGIIYSIKLFDVVWVMTKGGPANASQVLGTLEYQDTFELNQYGYGAAIANVMLVLSMIGGIVYVRFTRRGVRNG